ncbi:protein refolding chaperone Spy/CpxP family [Rhodospirillales bacterium URHD0017]|nr:protein refolding chaperone Spy/CpxP family [Rhodospirillales bacterium URHD0017]
MPRLVTVALALSLLLNGFFVAGFVYRGWVAPLPFEQRLPLPPPPAPPPPQARPSALEIVAGDLNLDPRQRQALRGVFEQHAQVRRERSREMQKVREQIVAEYKRQPLDQARLAPLIDRMGELRADQQKETVHALSQMEAQLDPEQRVKMHQILVDRLLSSPWARPPGPPPPPRPSQ